ncbi:hypothetical protein DSM112329_03541 [Paraconexibacter sp. AEG42_29]|uniref:Glycoside hydrolase family 5 domain-containing protein n=1 Tax=Paraconexibacter sp. AEG42_29 TaxID=2997339 RepID=A0AAU7AZ35_9ACTN
MLRPRVTLLIPLLVLVWVAGWPGPGDEASGAGPTPAGRLQAVARPGGTAHLPANTPAPAGIRAPAPIAVAGRAGRWIVDTTGRVVVLRGMNMVAKRPPYLPSRLGFGADDAAWLREQGFTAVRLGIIASGVAPTQRGSFDEAYLDDIAATVRQLHAAGIATLVDLHQDYYTESTGGEGFPGWMTHKRPGLASLGVGRADATPFDGLWANTDGVQDDIAAIWERVATRLRDVPGILGYDLFNEPYPGSRVDECARLEGCPAFDSGVLRPFFRRLTAGVRAADPRRLVFVEPGVNFNQGAATWIGDTGDPQTGFSFHVYCSPVVGSTPCATRQPRAFANAEKQVVAGRQTSLLTEFGATDDLGRLRSVLEDADRAMVGWLHWAYFNEDPFAARPHEGLVRTLAEAPGPRTVKAEKLAVLARPGPVLIAGTPRGWSWNDSAERLEVTWSTAAVVGARALVRRVRPAASGGGGRTVGAARPDSRARGSRATAMALPKWMADAGEGGVSVIELPPATVRAGWRVRVTGGRVVSAAGDRRVRVLADRGTTDVTVVVDRG